MKSATQQCLLFGKLMGSLTKIPRHEQRRHSYYGRRIHSLRFKCVNSQDNIWSVRITRGIRAVGKLKDDTVTWFWVGNHDQYEKFFG